MTAATPPHTARWITAGAALWILGLAGLWAVRPQWGYCIDGPTDGGCASGTEDSIALTVGVVGIVLLAALVACAVLVRGSARLPVLIALLAALVVALALGFSLSLSPVATPYF